MSDLLEYKCPCCGGAIEFNSTLQKMKCPYCDTEFDMETVKEFNEAAANQQSDELNWESASDNSWKEDETSGMSQRFLRTRTLHSTLILHTLLPSSMVSDRKSVV